MLAEKAASNFLEDLYKVRRLSQNTYRAYKNDLGQFMEFCSSAGKNSLSDITEKNIHAFILLLNELELSREKNDITASTVSRKLSALRSFFNFCVLNNYIDKNPAKNIRNPRIKRTLPEILTNDEIKCIPDKVKEKNDTKQKGSSIRVSNKMDSRELIAIFEVLYCCSLRVSELCDLRIKDIDYKREVIRIVGKGAKTRFVPIGKESTKILKNYLDTRENLDYNSFVFVTPGGNKVYPRLIHRIVKKYLTEVSDIKKKSPHIFRHSAATHMLNNGADLLAVKEILGHENLSTTQIYTHVSIERLKQIHKTAHPKS